MAEVGVVIVNFRTPKLVERCIASLAGERATNHRLQVIVVDGGSADGSAEAIGQFIRARGWGDWVRLVALEVNGGFGFANNHGVAAFAPEFPDHILFLNPDAEVTEGVVRKLTALMDAEPDCGVAGANIFSIDGGETSCAFRNPTVLREFCRATHWSGAFRLLRQQSGHLKSAAPIRAGWVSGAAVMIRTQALAEAGLFDDGFFLYFEEGELMHRAARHGWQVWHHPDAIVRHIGSAATGVYTGGTLRPERLPRYWFESRRRYYVRTRGPAFAASMALASLSGEVLHAFAALIFGRPKRSPRAYWSDLLLVTLLPRARDFTPSIPALAGSVHLTPGWSNKA